MLYSLNSFSSTFWLGTSLVLLSHSILIQKQITLKLMKIESTGSREYDFSTSNFLDDVDDSLNSFLLKFTIISADPEGPGLCALFLTAVSFILFLVTLPFSLCTCVKVSSCYLTIFIYLPSLVRLVRFSYLYINQTDKRFKSSFMLLNRT